MPDDEVKDVVIGYTPFWCRACKNAIEDEGGVEVFVIKIGPGEEIGKLCAECAAKAEKEPIRLDTKEHKILAEMSVESEAVQSILAVKVEEKIAEVAALQEAAIIEVKPKK